MPIVGQEHVVPVAVLNANCRSGACGTRRSRVRMPIVSQEHVVPVGAVLECQL